MKSYAYAFVALLCLALSSCEKDTDPQIIPLPVDTLKSVFPKQLVITDYTFTPSTILVGSIKYDTLNGRIDYYSDDTTNTNPYDQLAGTYLYNSSGYLISHNKYDQGHVIETSTINRDADNRINWIAHEEKETEKKDTSFLSYETFSGGTKITTIVNTYYNTQAVSADTVLHTYDTGNKLLQVLYAGGSITYEYNANNSIRRVLNEPTDFTSETNFFYASGIADKKEDIVLGMFLGKDAWIQNVRSLYFLSPFRDERLLIVSATDAFRPTRIQKITNRKGVITTKELTIAYELNDRKLPYKVTGSIDGQHETTLIFKY